MLQIRMFQDEFPKKSLFFIFYIQYSESRADQLISFCKDISHVPTRH